MVNISNILLTLTFLTLIVLGGITATIFKDSITSQNISDTAANNGYNSSVGIIVIAVLGFFLYGYNIYKGKE